MESRLYLLLWLQRWRPYTVSLTYCNYGGNRFSPEPGRKATRFDQGGWTVGYKFPLPEKMQQLLLLDPDGSVGCNAGFTYVRNYSDAETNAERLNKKKVSLGCKYTIWKWVYFTSQPIFIPRKAKATVGSGFHLRIWLLRLASWNYIGAVQQLLR